MNYEFFLVKKITKIKHVKKNISNVIVGIAISTVAIGIIIMNIAVSTGLGLKKEIKSSISNYQGHISINSYDRAMDLTSPISIKQDFYPNFNNVEGIKKIQPYCNTYGIIRKNDYFEGVILKGIDSSYDLTFLSKKLVEGRMIKIKNDKVNDSVLVSESISNKINLSLNDRFNIFFITKNGNIKIRTFRIGGIFKTSISDFDNNFIIGDIKHVQNLSGLTRDSVTGFEVIIDDISKLDIKAKEIYKSISYDLDVSTIKEKNLDLMNWLDLFDINITFIIIIILIVCLINILATFMIIIIEKKNLINILKYLGATNLSIMKIFVYICLYFVIRGLFIGNIISLALLLLQKYLGIINLDENVYYVDSISVLIDPVYIILLNILILLICFITTIIPSMVVKKYNIINI